MSNFTGDIAIKRSGKGKIIELLEEIRWYSDKFPDLYRRVLPGFTFDGGTIPYRLGFIAQRFDMKMLKGFCFHDQGYHKKGVVERYRDNEDGEPELVFVEKMSRRQTEILLYRQLRILGNGIIKSGFCFLGVLLFGRYLWYGRHDYMVEKIEDLARWFDRII